MTKYDLHTGAFAENCINAEEIEESRYRAAQRTVRIIADELEHIQFDIGLLEMDVHGVTSQSIADQQVAEELQRLLSLALALQREVFVLRDICPSCPTGQDGADELTRTVDRISLELRRAFSASGTMPAPSRLSLHKGKFDLRFYLCGAGPTVYPGAETIGFPMG